MTLESVYRVPHAAELLYKLLRERSTEDDAFVNISHRKLPRYCHHVQFVKSKPYRFWYLIEAENQYVGYVSATHRNEIGIVLFRAHRGNGYGPQALAQFLGKHKPLRPSSSKRSARWLANINPDNARSIRLFEGIGFTHLQSTYSL